MNYQQAKEQAERDVELYSRDGFVMLYLIIAKEDGSCEFQLYMDNENGSVTFF